MPENGTPPNVIGWVQVQMLEGGNIQAQANFPGGHQQLIAMLEVAKHDLLEKIKEQAKGPKMAMPSPAATLALGK